MIAQSSYSVYKITSPEGKVYIGSSCRKDLKSRYRYGHGYRHNVLFWGDIQRFGWRRFTTEVLEQGLSAEDAKFREEYYIRIHDSCNPQKGYNKARSSVLAYASMTPERRRETVKKQMAAYWRKRQD